MTKGGSPKLIFHWNPVYFYLVAYTKFQNPSCLLSGRKVRESERKKTNNAKYYGYFGAGARTLLGPKFEKKRSSQIIMRIVLF